MGYVSEAQRGYFHAHKKELESQGVDVAEGDRASKGKKLPKRKRKNTKRAFAVHEIACLVFPTGPAQKGPGVHFWTLASGGSFKKAGEATASGAPSNGSSQQSAGNGVTQGGCGVSDKPAGRLRILDDDAARIKIASIASAPSRPLRRAIVN
jgi:hypothetical protein